MFQLGLAVVLASPLPWTTPAHDQPEPIYGGEIVEPGGWPAAVAIILPDTRCTGTLVSDRLVLTAAHCFKDNPPVDAVTVLFGDDVYTEFTKVLDIDEYGSHPEYCGPDTTVCKVDVWDYAYVLLSTPVADVAPVLPVTDQAQWDELMRVGADVTVVGYGQDEGTLSGIKREVDVPIVRFSPTGLEFQAGGDGKDSCQGDSGGPAFATTKAGQTFLAGITSRGYDCGKGGFYAIPYAALCWVNQETGIDLRTDACDACDCLDIDPSEDKQCGCETSDPAGPLGLALLLLWGGLRTPAVRRRRTCRP